MNDVNLIGRLTRDPEVRYTQNNMAVARFSIAIDRMNDGTDFPSIVAFGKDHWKDPNRELRERRAENLHHRGGGQPRGISWRQVE